MEDSTKMALRKETNYDASWDVVTSSSFSTDPVLVGPPGGDTGSWVGEAEEFEEFSSTDWEISEGSIHLDPVLAQELDSPGMSNSWFLEKVLKNKQATKAFMKFLQNRHCSENLMFWLAAERYRSIDASNTRKLKKKTDHMWRKYLDPSGPFEINIPYEQREAIRQCVPKPHPEMFVVAQKSVFLLMVHGTFDYFLKSERYRAFKDRQSSASSSPRSEYSEKPSPKSPKLSKPAKNRSTPTSPIEPQKKKNFLARTFNKHASHPNLPIPQQEDGRPRARSGSVINIFKRRQPKTDRAASFG